MWLKITTHFYLVSYPLKVEETLNSVRTNRSAKVETRIVSRRRQFEVASVIVGCR